MLGSRVVDLKAISSFFDCLLPLVDELYELPPFRWIYGFIAPFGLASANILILVTNGRCSGLGFQITDGRRHLRDVVEFRFGLGVVNGGRHGGLEFLLSSGSSLSHLRVVLYEMIPILTPS